MTGTKIFSCALMVLLITSNAHGDDMDKGRLKIGAIFPFSGPQEAYGQEALAGMELALQHVAISDPELVSRVDIIKGDDQGKPSEAARVAEQLISKDRVSLLFGSTTAPASLEIAKVAQRLQRPMIIPASTNPGITSIGEFIFRTCLTDPDQGKSLAAFARTTLTRLNAATLVNKDVGSTSEVAAQFVGAFLKLGGKVDSRESYDSKTKSYKDILKKIVTTKPDVILIPGRAQDVAKIAKEMTDMGMTIPILGSDGLENASIGKTSGGAYYSVHFSTEVNNQSVADFVERFKKKVNRFPSSLAAMTYDGTLAAVEAYRAGRSTQAVALSKALARIKDFPVIAGTMTINADRNANKTGIIMEITPSGSRFKTLVAFPTDLPISIVPTKKDAG